LSEAGPGGAKQFAVRGLREGWAWTPRHWVEVTEDTGVGNPANATAEKGSRFFAAVTQQIAAFLKELADADPAALYE
jgi:creatinine amidohydrolase